MLYFQIGQWHPADEYDGQLREITFRCICNSPMCPPDTAMTEWQHAVLSPDKKTLVQWLLPSFIVLFLVLDFRNLVIFFVVTLFVLSLAILNFLLVFVLKFFAIFFVFYVLYFLFHQILLIVLGVWDSAAGSWCSIRVLLRGMQYIDDAFWLFGCNIFWILIWDWYVLEFVIWFYPSDLTK